MSTRHTGLKLGLLVAAMFAFAFALVPLYEVFCQVTGLNGKLAASDPGARRPNAAQREVAVQFVANVQGRLPWRFTPLQRRVRARTGELVDVIFEIENLSDRPTLGRAVTNLMPGPAAAYLHKVECFCFSAQPMAPGELRRVHLRFFVDAALPERYRTLTLAYTFVEPPVERRDAG